MQFTWDNLPSLLWRIQLAMVWRHSSFLIDKIWLDWQGNILLWIILFSVLGSYILIGKIRTFQIIIVRPLGLADRAFTLGCHRGAWVLHWAYHSFGLGRWPSELIFLTPSVAPQPLCTECVGKGCNSSCTGLYFHVSPWSWIS